MAMSTAEFLTLLLAAVSLYCPDSSDLTLKPPDTPQSSVEEKYDFIIVGAGSAGCVLANRLSEVPKWKILLIESGGDEDAISDTPYLHFLLRNTQKSWNYTTVRQQKACLSLNGICAYPRGRVMGGSSTINAMMYVRGNPADYDDWATTGNPGWSYKDVLPYFIKSENNTVPGLQNNLFHGYNGYLTVGYSMYRTPLAEKYIKAGNEFGWTAGDYNGKTQEKIGYLQTTTNGISRESTSKAYLNPIINRPNLFVIKHAHVTKLSIEGKHVKGVEYYRNGLQHTVFAKVEVILSAGSIDTPKLLMLSGIGPTEELKKHNIKQVADLPVGQNLQDHLLMPIFFEIKSNETIKERHWKSEEAIHEYTIKKNGPLTTTGVEVMAFLNVINKNEPPNLQIMFSSTPPAIIQSQENKKNIINIFLSNVFPRSRGSVRLRSSNWTHPPLIDPNYFDEDVDFQVFRKGFQLVLDFMKTPSMASLSPKLYTKIYTKCQSKYKPFKLRDYIKCIIMNYSGTIYHPVSTAKMGPKHENNTVVTPDLLVKGFKNLRVIDASIMPRIVRGNTNAPTIMIAEKGADLIKAYHRPPSQTN